MNNKEVSFVEEKLSVEEKSLHPEKSKGQKTIDILVTVLLSIAFLTIIAYALFKAIASITKAVDFAKSDLVIFLLILLIFIVQGFVITTVIFLVNKKKHKEKISLKIIRNSIALTLGFMAVEFWIYVILDTLT